MNSRWRFGLFEIDAVTGELRKEGRRIRLQDQPFQILVRLLQRPGELVTREELQSVWPDDTFVDFDLGLNTAIKKIRLALGDSAENPRFIETLPRKGYRFIAPVSAVAESAPPARAPEVPLAKPRNWFPVLAGLLVALAGGAWYFANHRVAAPLAFSAPEPLTSYPGIETQPAISPDGSLIAFSWNGPGQNNVDIYLKQAGQDEPRRLTSHEFDDVAPAFSPDGKRIAFARRDARNGALGDYSILVMPATGGLEAMVGVTVSPPVVLRCSPLTWSPDGQALVVGGRSHALKAAGLLRIPLAGGEPEVLVQPVSETNDSCPAFSPDGRSLAFIRSGWGGYSEVYVQPLDANHNATGRAHPTPKIGFALSSAWLPDSQTLLIADGSDRIWKVPASAGQPERLDSLGTGLSYPAVSVAGKLVFSRTTAASSRLSTILSVDLKGNRPPRPLLASTRGEGSPRYSPDGRRIVFTSNRSGSSEVWVANVDGSEASRLTSLGPDGMRGWPSWSPDGTKVLFDSTKGREGAGRTWHIYVVSATGGAPVRLTDGDATNGVAGWSHDGKSVYFYSNRSGSDQIWKMSATGGPARQITKRKGRLGMESPDGLYYYYTQTYQDLWRVPVEGGEETPVRAGIRAFHFKPAKDGIYHTSKNQETGGQAIQFFSFATRRDTVILSIPEQLVGPSLEISPDGRTLLYSLQKESEADLMQVTLGPRR